MFRLVRLLSIRRFVKDAAVCAHGSWSTNLVGWGTRLAPKPDSNECSHDEALKPGFMPTVSTTGDVSSPPSHTTAMAVPWTGTGLLVEEQQDYLLRNKVKPNGYKRFLS